MISIMVVVVVVVALFPPSGIENKGADGKGKTPVGK